MPDRI